MVDFDFDTLLHHAGAVQTERVGRGAILLVESHSRGDFLRRTDVLRKHENSPKFKE